MSLLSRITQSVANVVPLRPSSPLILPSQQRPPAEMYRALRAYYQQTGLYDALAVALFQQGTWREALKGLRNPAFRAVEFHVATLWPGTLEEAFALESDNAERIRPAIDQVWQWSNWAAKKQVSARQISLFGDVFLKVAATEDQARVYFQSLEPEYVTDLELDERGYVTYLRLDVPKAARDEDGKITSTLHTEVWDKARGTFRLWETRKSPGEGLDRLGTPNSTKEIAEFGIDFVPIVHAPFRDVGEDRGVGCFTYALDKIDEANRQATRLHQMLFRNNRNTWALRANAMDASGRPLPPPQVNTSGGSGTDVDTVDIGDETFLRLPGQAELVSLVPNLHYAEALAILQDMMGELEQDLPELAYYRVTERSDLSGRALRLMLAPALQRAAEARGNAQAALVRADAMALTMGANLGLFADLGGTFADGAFDHTFAEREVLPVDPQDQAEVQRARGLAVQAYASAGVAVEQAVALVHEWDSDDPRRAAFTADNVAAIQREQLLAQEDAGPVEQ